MPSDLFSQQLIERIEKLRGFFPLDHPRSMVMMALRYIQEEQGYITPESVVYLADYLGIPCIHVQEIVSFYSVYRTEPQYTTCVKVCQGLPCALRGASALLDYMRSRIRPDHALSLGITECQAACTQAPVVLVQDTDIVPLATMQAVDDFLLRFVSDEMSS